MTVNFEESARDRFIAQEILRLSPLFLVPEGLEVLSLEPLADPVDAVVVRMEYDILHYNLVLPEMVERGRFRPKTLVIRRRNFSTDPEVPKLGFIYVGDGRAPTLGELLEFVNDRLDTHLEVQDIDTSILRLQDHRVLLPIRPESIYYSGRILINVY